MQGSKYHPKDEGERYRYVAYALYCRTGEAMTVRERVNRLLAPANGSFDPGDGLGREMAVIVCGDFNNEPDAATTQILQGPASSEFGTGGFDAEDKGDGYRLWNVAPLLNLGPNGELPAEEPYTRVFKGRDELGSRAVFAIEGTGPFGGGLCRELLAAGYSVVEINRPDRSTRRRLGKDDAIDAEASGRSFLAGTATMAPKGGTHLVEMIRLLKGNKDSASKSRTRAINQIKAILVTAPAGLREQLEPLAHDVLIATSSAFRVALVDSPMAAAKKALHFLARRVLHLEQEIAELLDDLDQLTQQACPGLRQTYGIGTDGAATLLVTVGDHPERLRSDAAFASL